MISMNKSLHAKFANQFHLRTKYEDLQGIVH